MGLGVLKRSALAYTVMLVVVGTIALPVDAAGAAPTREPSGRSLLESVAPDATLNCVTTNTASDWLAFFARDNFRPAVRSCATLVSVRGIGLFGPREFAGTDGRVGAAPLRTFVPISQRVYAPRAASATVLVETTVGLPGTGLVLSQRDTYHGDDTMETSVTLRNPGRRNLDVVIYRTGDCFPGADVGYGISGRGSVGCEQAVQRGRDARPAPGPLYIRWEPKHGVSRFIAGEVTDVRDAIGSGAAFANTCDCLEASDGAAALSWDQSLPAGATLKVGHRLTLSTGAGREPSRVAVGVAGTGSSHRLLAWVTTRNGGVAGAPVDFVIGSLTVCTARTDRNGVASCPWRGASPRVIAISSGDAWTRPALGSFVPTTPPPLSFDGFPACARFDRAAGGLVTGGDAHHEWIGVTTLAPPCPGVIYRAKADGTTIGSIRGDGRTVNFVGDVETGFATFFIDTDFGLVTQGCVRIESIDSRTGQVVDAHPARGGCLTKVAGQKFR